MMFGFEILVVCLVARIASSLPTAAELGLPFENPAIEPQLFVVGREYSVKCEIMTTKAIDDFTFPLVWTKGTTTLHATESHRTEILRLMEYTGFVQTFFSLYNFTAQRENEGDVLTCTANLRSGTFSTALTVHVYDGTLCDSSPCDAGSACSTGPEAPHKYQCTYNSPHAGNPCTQDICVNQGQCTYDQHHRWYTCEYDSQNWINLVGR